MIRRVSFYLISVTLSLIPVIVIFLIATPLGTNVLVKSFERATDTKITGVSGTLVSGKIDIEQITSSNNKIKDISIKIATKNQYPWVKMSHLDIGYMKINIFPQSSGSFLPPILPEETKINRVKFNLLGEPINLSDLLITNKNDNFYAHATWNQLPFDFNFSPVDNDRFEIKAQLAKQSLKLLGINKNQNFHLQSPPADPGHLTMYYDQKNNQWTVDCDYHFDISDQLKIIAQMSSNWQSDHGELDISRLQIHYNDLQTLISGKIIQKVDSSHFNISANAGDNDVKIFGGCDEVCDYEMRVQMDNLSQLTNDNAGDFSSVLHVYGPRKSPKIDMSMSSKFLRGKRFSADNFSYSTKSYDTEITHKISADRIGYENHLIDLPISLNATLKDSRLVGKLLIDNTLLPFSGNISTQGGIRLKTRNAGLPMNSEKDLNLSFDYSKMSLTFHPICFTSESNSICLSAIYRPEEMIIDLDRMRLNGSLNIPLLNSTSFLYIKDYAINGKLHLSSADKLKLNSHIVITTGDGFISNILPDSFVPINYGFTSTQLVSSDDGQSLRGQIKSDQGNIDINMGMIPDLGGLSLKVSLPNFQFKHHLHSLNGSSYEQCTITHKAANCDGETLLKNSSLQFLNLSPTPEISEDILINSPIHIKHSAGYAINLNHTVTIDKTNFLDVAGFSGPVTGDIRIISPSNSPTRATGQIKLQPGQFSLFGKTINLAQAEMVYHNDPIKSPIFNISAHRRIQSTANHLTNIKVSIFGRPDHMNIEMKSQPETLSQFEIISALFAGKQKADWQPKQDRLILSILKRATGNVEILNLLKTINEIERSLNIDSLAITPQMSISHDLSDTIRSTKITLSKILSRDMYLRYQFQLNENRNGKISFIYQLPRNFLIEMYLNRQDSGINLLYQN